MLPGFPDNTSLLLLLDKVQAATARDAFSYVIGWAATLRGYECFPSRHGKVQDFRFYRGTSQDFAFIPNRRWLLFYFRRPCQKLPGLDDSTIRHALPSAKKNRSKELTIKIGDIATAKAVAELIERAIGGAK